MPGPAVTVEILGDTSDLDAALSAPASGFQKFAGALSGALAQVGGVAGAVSLAVEGFGKLVELGGPEAQEALAGLQKAFGEEMAPVMAELVPLIVDLVKGLTELMTAVLPVLVPLLQGLVSILGLLFAAAGIVVDIIRTLVDVAKGLIDNQLNLLWEKLDAIRGMFDLVWQAVETVITWFGNLLQPIRDLLGPIGEVVAAVSGLLGDLGEALGLTDEVSAAATGLGGGRRAGGAFGPGAGGTSVTIYTGADPGAVMRAQRRYMGNNGGARLWGARGAQVRGW